MRRRLFAVVSVVGSLLVSGLAAEIGFRIFLRWRAERHLARVIEGESREQVDTGYLGDIIRLSTVPDLVYELKPRLRGRFLGQPLATNAWAMRAQDEVAVDRTPGVFRVVGVGDSFMFGQGVANGETYLDRLAGILMRHGLKSETLNFGVPGYNTFMEARLFEHRAARFSPDVVVVGVVGNDWDLPNFMLTRPYTSGRHSFALAALTDLFRPAPSLVPTPASRVYPDHLLAVPEEVPPEYRHMVGYAGYARALEGLVRKAKSIGARVVLFSDCVPIDAPGTRSCTFPYKPGEWERLRSGLYSDPAVTLCPAQLAPELTLPNDGHPSVAGHDSLAEQLANCLRRNHLLSIP